MTSSTLNENRGAERAAELRRRFRHVSDASFGHPQFGMWPTSSSLKGLSVSARRRHIRELTAWVAMAGVVLFIGVLIF